MTAPAQAYPHLSQPLHLRGFCFRNRVLTSPVNQPFYSDNGALSEEGTAHLVEQARGGFAQVTIGEQPVDPAQAEGKGFRVYTSPMDLRAERSLRSVVEQIHAQGALASIELGHPGSGFRYPPGKEAPIYGPSEEIAEDGIPILPMDRAKMDEVIDQFCSAAQRFQALGFDGVVLHSAHGCLLAQFLSARTNHRTDEYGGSLENRMRFPVELVQRVRQAVGEHFLLELRISGSEFVPGGITVEDNVAFCKQLEGVVDLIHVSAGIYSIPALFVRVHPDIYYPNGCNADLAQAIRREIGTPVVVVGAINTPELAEEILASEKADFVAVGRQAIADPHFVNKSLNGHRTELRPCIRCLNCMDIRAASEQKLHCTVNPRAGRLLAYPEEFPPAKVPKRVVIVGGGPGGMAAAITAAKCGHSVILLEKSSTLGGALRFSERDTYKTDLCRYKNALIDMVAQLPIEVHLNIHATQELLEQIAPDAVLAATGARPIRPSIPGIQSDHVMSAVDAYDHPDRLGGRIIIIGGGLVGCESAVHLTAQGHTVTLLEAGTEVARDCTNPHKIGLMEQLKKIPVHTGCKVLEIRPEGVRFACGGRELLLPCDTVLYATGMRKVLPEDLRAEGWIGDCARIGKVLDAIRDGYFAALEL